VAVGGEPKQVDLREAKGVQVGSGLNFQVNVLQDMPRTPARSAYLEQVRRIAPPSPPGLQDRDAELAELALFCLDADGPSYAWWRAGPWAGKSALLSTFVLRPPPNVAGRVRIVSFFITARLAAQDTREAFTQVLLEQLATLLGQSLPAVLPEATREAFLLDLMSQAASACQDAGGRLVLVVDGLDEDRGTTAGPDAHSIAGLLPASPPAGMRVIVASRPAPPVPDDVPGWHPLRDPRISRPLTPSAHAKDVQRLARQELKRLLHSTPAEQDLLGLVTAARGGLSARDLADLVGIPLWEIEDVLQATAGRTFRGRPSRYDIDARPEVFLLGHEELQAAAAGYLGDQRLAGYRQRLHDWASGYRARQWPPETPEYLLSGYFRLLDDLGDLPRMTGCALDAARHDMMLDLTGGDAAALAEARITLDRIAAQDQPDLASALEVACHRDHIADRNAHIPESLPAVWAALGQQRRAEALARSITNPGPQASALAQVAGALARAGQHQQAEALARSITEPTYQAGALAQVAGALAQAGRREQAIVIAAQAEAAARPVTDPTPQASALDWPRRHRQAEALAQVAGALAQAGQHQQAEALARPITEPVYRAGALAQVAGALAQAGQHEQAIAIAAQAEAAARSITDPAPQANALARVAGALAQAGWHEQPIAIAAQAEAAARSVTEPTPQASALAHVAGTLARSGWHEQAIAIAAQAEAAARSITETGLQAMVLAEVAGALAQSGQHQQAEALARSITETDYRASALAQVADALAGAGEHQQAIRVATAAEAEARSATEPDLQASALARVAAELAHAGQFAQAIAIAAQAETAGRSITMPRSQARALAQVAGALAQAGQHEQAIAIAAQAMARLHSITEPASETRAWDQVSVEARVAGGLAQVAGALAQAGRHEQAIAIAAQAETAARSITMPEFQASALAGVAEALGKAGWHEQAIVIAAQAEAMAGWISEPAYQAIALAQVAGALAQAGRDEQAIAIAAQAEAVARSITKQASRAGVSLFLEVLDQPRQIHHPNAVALIPEHSVQERVLSQVARALAQAGQLQKAEAVTRSITEPDYRASALAQVAEVLARAGQHEQAIDFARRAEATARLTDEPDFQASVLAQVAGVLALAGETRSAAQVTAAVCATGTWLTALKPVLQLAPSAATALNRILQK
jgi:hypothetical protein